MNAPVCHSAQVTLVSLSNRLLSCNGQKRCRATTSHQHLFGGSRWRKRWSYVSWGVAVLCGAAVSPRWHNLKYVTFTLHHLYFWSPLGLKRRAGFWYCLAFPILFLFFFYCSHALLPSKRQLHGPWGGWFWSDGVSSLSHIGESLRPGCPRPVTVLSLSLSGHFAAQCCLAAPLLTSAQIEKHLSVSSWRFTAIYCIHNRCKY